MSGYMCTSHMVDTVHTLYTHCTHIHTHTHTSHLGVLREIECNTTGYKSIHIRTVVCMYVRECTCGILYVCMHTLHKW